MEENTNNTFWFTKKEFVFFGNCEIIQEKECVHCGFKKHYLTKF